MKFESLQLHHIEIAKTEEHLRRAVFELECYDGSPLWDGVDYKDEKRRMIRHIIQILKGKQDLIEAADLFSKGKEAWYGPSR